MNKKSMILGIVLITAGLITGLSALNIMPGSVFLLVLALGFLTAYVLLNRNLGFLIPGSILASIGIFAIIEEQVKGIDGSLLLVLMGLAFLVLIPVHTGRLTCENWGGKYWPLFPGVSLMLIGALIFSKNAKLLDFDLNLLNFLTPVALLIVGAIIILSGLRKKA